MTIDIVGSGAIGTAFARTLARAGSEATIANSRGPDSTEPASPLIMRPRRTVWAGLKILCPASLQGF